MHAEIVSGVSPISDLTPSASSGLATTLRWMAKASADDVIAPLNVLCARRGEELMVEPVRRFLNASTRARTWNVQWKTTSTLGIGIKVALWIDERAPREVHISVNGKDVSVTSPPLNCEVRDPEDDDLDNWLCDEVLVPVTCALDEILMTHGGMDQEHPRFAHLLAPPDDPDVAELLEALGGLSGEPVEAPGEDA